MSLQRGEGFFEAVFGFKEVDYFSTRHQLFQKYTFESNRRSTSTGMPRVFKERALFEHPAFGRRHLISGGWHSTPSVAELRAETAELVCAFEEKRPGLLASFQKTPPLLQGETEVLQACASSTVPTSTAGSSIAPWVQCSHTVGESGALHLRFPNAFFQVASQFNSLEFVSPDVTPEDGVTHYVYDRTQGPACALACMAGTAYRNYLFHPALFNTDVAQEAEVGEQQRGQQALHQLNLLDDLTTYLTQGYSASAASALPTVDFDHFYRVRSGYFHPAPSIGSLNGWLERVATSQGTTPADVKEALLSRLRVALVEGATVTLPLHDSHKDGASLSALHEVSQVYSSALSLPPPPAKGSDDAWAGVELLSRIILDGTYEATLLAGVQHTLRSLEQQSKDAPAMRAGRSESTIAWTLPPIFLTKVGGGVFNNDGTWIASAITSAVTSVGALGVPLDVRLVHHRAVEPYYAQCFPSWPMRKST
ncbi:hypothetical protein ABB37_01771 [Leptomonas pyrrhocoris]|uniref:Uncharacterized protein n=1 Tax=Leptomonas pyrrhocoris TaxID=157538 RepID=A0A0M9G999_LEPPY|nr:hypothetical protein ABB37_01771 [Leptomonas pyrrhocoris]KPA85480.1 hypothetical protein ABB37_01771 [Leptomonas pyrrhocoris]|eukprot:XP_015663919.1 hypothetical protein ABB37_01771 [Leptomonas pyrrhocoris]